MSACRAISINVTSGAREQAVADLRSALAAVPALGFAEIWVNHDQFPALSALLHDDAGWLMYLRYEGDAGFSSRNVNYSGEPDAKIEYLLSNGQLDEYPAAWAYSRREVFLALEFFALHGRVPEDIRWSNDSGDGRSPNDRNPAP
jgi:hypothetical protein